MLLRSCRCSQSTKSTGPQIANHKSTKLQIANHKQRLCPSQIRQVSHLLKVCKSTKFVILRIAKLSSGPPPDFSQSGLRKHFLLSAQ
jgi:hypothetical protein